MAFFLRRWRCNFFTNIFPQFIVGILFIYLYSEYIIYYVTQIQCGWSSLSKEYNGVNVVYAMVIADTHLLGSRDSHWLDKWRREWQMHRAFQTAMTLHQPEVVFVLGDLFDEGKWCTEKEFNDYVERFHKLFKVPNGTMMYAVVGNHDIGFHYRITPHLADRFESQFNAPPVQLVSIKGNHFVLINSMAMEGDGCTLCSRALVQIDNITNLLKCSSGSSLCKGKTRLARYSRPIIMQHYPLYRESDSICTEPDAAPLPERNGLFEERWDCLSKESTEYLVENLLPRAAFGAHTHHGCVVRHSFMPTSKHKIEFIEYTVPSFSWRNRLDPKYYLVTSPLIIRWNVVMLSSTDLNMVKKSPVHIHPLITRGIKPTSVTLIWCGLVDFISMQLTITPNEVKVSKCSMPREWTMQVTAILMTIALVVYLRYFNVNINLLGYKYLSGKKV